ncbi:hypothetical protein SAZ11_40560 [Streptomyces sp. FXJ1.4098]|nr:hypothetical protein [Streptomyces sp. FXJ1.4098]
MGLLRRRPGLAGVSVVSLSAASAVLSAIGSGDDLHVAHVVCRPFDWIVVTYSTPPATY